MRKVAAATISQGEIDCLKQSKLSATDINAALLAEILQQPECSSTPIPNYFNDDGSLRRDLLPDCISELKVNLDNLTCTRDEFCLFIWEVCVVPEGRETFFSDKPGSAKGFIFDMEIIDKSPWQEHLLPVSPTDKTEISKIINKNLNNNLIETSRSAYASRILLVRKPSGRHQIASNLTPLNNRVRKNAYPLPLIVDNLLYLDHCVHLSSIDVSGAYLSMPIPERF